MATLTGILRIAIRIPLGAGFFARTLAFVVAALCAVTFWSAPALAQPHIDVLSAWGGAVNSFQRAGNIGYGAMGQRFVVLDMSDEANIHELASITFPANVTCIVVQGNYAFVTHADVDQDPIMVIDVSNPASPQIVWRETPFLAHAVYCPGGPPLRGQYHGRYLYLLERNHLVVYDMIDPLHPVVLNGGNGTGCTAVGNWDIILDIAAGYNGCINDFAIVGDYMYVAADHARAGAGGPLTPAKVGVFRLEPDGDPIHPQFLGGVAVGNNISSANRIAVTADATTAAVQVDDESRPEDNTQVVKFVDVSDPAHPVLRSSYTNFFNAHSVAIQGHLAFVADMALRAGLPTSWARLKGLAIFDIANPSSPVLLGTYNTDHSSIRDVMVSGNRAYLQCDGQGLVVVDVSDPAHPARVGGFFSPAQLKDIFKVGNRLYVADAWNGFSILDVSNPASPQLLGVYQGAGDISHQQHNRVEVAGVLAYLAAGFGNIQVVDVSDPISPTMLRQLDDPYNFDDSDCRGLEIYGNILHTCGLPVGFGNFDLTNSPAVIPRLSAPDYSSGVNDLVTKDGITFAGYLSSAFQMMDNRDPANPVSLPGNYMGGDLELSGNYLCAASNSTTSGGLYIYDVTDALQPTQVGFASPSDLGEMINAVGVSGNRAATGSYAIEALDISNPSSPHVLATSHTGGVTDIVVDGGLIFSTNLGTLGNPLSCGGFLIRQLVEPPTCGSADFDCDGDVGTDADIEAFFACLAGNCPAPPCPNSADFNGDGDIGTDADIESFFRVLGGGPC